MNKTVNINLGGMFFYIDEDAYQKLSRYFDAIKRSLSNTSGEDEIIKDIEMRIAELLNEKLKNEKQVVSLLDIDSVIAVMGQPEDYIIEDEPKSFNDSNFKTTTRNKKLYRDGEKGMIGGVAAGLGHYFGIDKVWIRVVLLLLIFAGFGTGIIAYIILWIVTPEAQTTSEKLEMTGEPVNISNIEKKVRQEFETVSDKIKNADYNKYSSHIKKGANQAGNSIGNFIIAILGILAKFLGAFLIFMGLASLTMLLVGVFTIGSSSFKGFPWQGLLETGIISDYPIWLFGLLLFFAIGIPLLFLTLLGFKLLTPNAKSIGSIAKYTLLAIWIITIAIAISIGIQQASAFSMDGRIVKKENINLKAGDTLLIKFIHNDFYAKNNVFNNFKFTQDSTGNDVIYSNNIAFRIEKTSESIPYIQIEKEAKGTSISEARTRAERIKYNYSIQENQIIFDNYLLSDLKDKFRNQEIEITLYLPVGTIFKADASVQPFDSSDNNFFNLHYSSDDYHYKVSETQVKCLDCPDNENEYNDVENYDNNTSITINKNGITITDDSIPSSKNKYPNLKMDKNGIIINAN